jgi:hypothetical protein
MPSSVELSMSGSTPDDSIVASNENGNLEDNVVESEDKEDNMDKFMEASRCEPNMKEDICRWGDLRDQIKAKLEVVYKQHKPLTKINKLLVLQNFATLQIQGEGHIAASKHIAMQWQDSVDTNFAQWICFLAHHYQLFE